MRTPAHEALSGTPVLSVRRHPQGATVRTRRREERFDDIIFACHADQALALLADPGTRGDQRTGGLQVPLQPRGAPHRRRRHAEASPHLGRPQLPGRKRSERRRRGLMRPLLAQRLAAAALSKAALRLAQSRGKARPGLHDRAVRAPPSHARPRRGAGAAAAVRAAGRAAHLVLRCVDRLRFSRRRAQVRPCRRRAPPGPALRRQTPGRPGAAFTEPG